jgi:putative ABC transport system ATP-binding protein
MLELRDIHKYYTVGTNKLHVLQGIDLSVGAGELVAIMGSSGSGKSTLMNIIGLLDDYDSGEYRLAGELMRNLSEARAAQLRNRHIGFVFQSFHLVPFKTALENVALPLFYRGVSRRERLRLAETYLDRVGLADWAGHKPNELSGGQRQRVAIARSLITQPRLVLADEPTGALDSVTSIEVLELLRSINRDDGVTVIVITHEDDIAHLCRRLIHIKDGQILSDSPIEPKDPSGIVTRPTPLVLEPAEVSA